MNSTGSSTPALRHRYAFSNFPLRVLFVLLAISLVLLGCGTPTKAPVTSHDVSGKRTVKTKAKLAWGYHRVKRGDTLFSIAWQHGLDHKTLASWNGIRAPFLIYPGQRLRLTKPKKAQQTTGKPKVTASKATPSNKKGVKSTKPRVNTAKTKSKTKTARTNSKSSSIKKGVERVKLSWRWPTTGRVKQGFKPGDPSRKGIKVAGRIGQQVVAAESGRVVYAGSGLIGYGRLIIIKHNKNYLSAYGYNSKILVKEGDQVTKGAKIAEMGTQGSGKPLLHFEIRRNGTPVNPLKVLPRKR